MKDVRQTRLKQSPISHSRWRQQELRPLPEPHTLLHSARKETVDKQDQTFKDQDCLTCIKQEFTKEKTGEEKKKRKRKKKSSDKYYKI